ncbi:SusC/RagA family TonB-linked outer membrane protein [Mucilaginibacter mali]|uniref:SusC/RagA family TonB-linked outer membrane protein n=1 Tax=Mucilaginibacter mali TaxID=2740462 RepID=A0A7D4UH80_9SPHI|nr:SusC/RagA family TonB-linked outer membrane protein [Mucilaginibacter mali]QKJ32856.1 SusC/RagA family TonB-linked outer membrane protein [Mucilaginibacter mali]
MKLTTLLLIIALVQASAKGFAQKINLNETNAPLEKVINTIKQQSGYVFLYTDQELKNEKITVKVSNASIEETLKAAFKNTSVDYKIVGNNILLKKNEPTFIDKARAIFAQVTVAGKVQDETGQPLVGVTVKIKTTSQATASDANGTFAITVPDDKTIIVFSFIGYETIELAAKDIASGSIIRLKPVQTNLQEVIVNKGYYSVKQELNTGSTFKVTGDNISKQPGINPIAALEGRVPGLYISQFSGIPGAGVQVKLRGRNSIGSGNDPLYIVDGLPFSSISLTNPGLSGGALGAPPTTPIQPSTGLSPFNSLNPSDIEDIQILKDADATAIYGSRGANGVILITTKKGRPGRTKVDLNLTSGIGNVASRLPLLNTQQYLKLRREAFANDGKTPIASDYDINGTWDTTRYTDWQKEMIGRTARYSNGQISVSGGNTNTQFRLNAGSSRQDAVFPGGDHDSQVNVGMTVNYVSNDQKLKMQFIARYSNESNLVHASDYTAKIVLAPDAPAIYDNNGNLNWQNGTWTNPLSTTFTPNQSDINSLTGNIDLNYKLFSDLTLKTSAGYTRKQIDQTVKRFSGVVFAPTNDIRQLDIANGYNLIWQVEPGIEYVKKIASGQLNVLIGATFQKNISDSYTFGGYGFSSDALLSNVNFASTIYSGYNANTQYRYGALYSRIGYNWQDKYLFNIVGRRDGSSRFGPGNQFGNFGSIGAAWIFSKENFLKNVSWLSLGKLRASYGVTGNDQISDYQYLSTYGSNSNVIYQNIAGLTPGRIANPYYAWESVQKVDVGLELGMLNDRVNLSLDYYHNKTNNSLVQQPLPSIAGFTSVITNFPATVQNTGFELSLNTVNINTNDFTWVSDFNISFPKNKLASFPGLETNTTYINQYLVGMPLSLRKLYHYVGIDTQTGIPIMEDFNHDGLINTNDQRLVAAPQQTFHGGLENHFNYKSFSFSFDFQFVKQTGYNYINYFSLRVSQNTNKPVYLLDHWRTSGDNAQLPKATTGAIATYNTALSNFQGSDVIISDASFARLKNIQLSYTLPKKWEAKTQLKNTKISLTAQNLFTITKYLGLDPENQGLALPPMRMYTIGFQTSF